MGWWMLIVAAVTVAQVRAQVTVTPYLYPKCAPPNTTQISAGATALGLTMPPLPKLPTTFQTRVEANIIDKGLTVVAEEYYDGPNNRAAVRTLQNGTMDYMIFDYKDNQILNVVNNFCYATPLQFDSNSLLFGMNVSSSSVPHIYTTNGALHFAQANGLMYIGKANIRGINVDHWQSCMYWGLLASNFTLDYYFAVPNWTEPDSSHQIPVRAEIVGVQTKYDSQGNPISKPFHHIYEYFDFRNKVWGDDSLFETPKGMTCTGRKQTRAVPQLSGQYAYREEIVDLGAHSVQQADIWYDYTYKLVRFDYRPAVPFAPFYTTNPVTEIHDYYTGISYAIDRTLGNCTTLPISNVTFGTNINISSTSTGNGKQFYLKMKSPSQLFYLDNTSYTYEGQRVVRDMTCDVFIANRTDFSIYGYTGFTSVFEFYFLAKTWTESNDVGNTVKQSTDIPIQLVITTPNWVGYKAEYNIYNFDSEDPSYNRFDVSSCFDDDSKMDFQITFPGPFDDSMVAYKNTFLQKTMERITNVGHVEHLRIQNARFTINSDQAYFLGTLTDVPPPLAFYQKLPGTYLQFSNDAQVTVTGPQDCADACNNPMDKAGISACNSFDFCPGQALCSLSKTHTEDGTLASSSTCDHYTRTVKYAAYELPLPKAWTLITNNVEIGDFQVVFNVGGSMQRFTASAITNNINNNQNAQGGAQIALQSLITQFNAQMGKDIPGYDDLILTGDSITDCAAACISQQSWVCNSFSYCSGNNWCVLSKIHPDERPNLVVNSVSCDLYTRKYTAQYNQLPGTTVLSSSDTIYQNIYSADECAKLCNNYHGFTCKSFDYCDDISTCYLGRKHYYDIPQTSVQTSTMCNHYSRKYLSDFQKTPRVHLTNKQDRIVSGVNVDQCAKLCVEQEAAQCATFGYCGNTTECRLSTVSMKNVGQVSSEASMWCDVYSRLSFPDGTPYINPNTQPVNPGGPTPSGPVTVNPHYPTGIPGPHYTRAPQQCPPQVSAQTGNNNGKYTGGAMAGLAFGMLIMGVLLAAGIFLVVSKFRSQPNDNMAVAFVKADHE